jgi:C1q domain
MKKLLFLSLFISFKMFGQTPKIDVVVGDTENVDAIVGTVKRTNPTGNYYGIKGENLAENGFGSGVLGTHVGSGSGVYGSSVIGTGVIGYSPTGRGVSGLSNGNGGVGGYFNSTLGHALITNTGNVGFGTSTPTKAFMVVDKKIGAVHAIFGENTSGVAIESSWPGISFNGYYNNGRKPLSNGFVGGMAMNPSTGLISIYNTFASGTAGNNVTTQDVITMDNFGKVGIGNSSPQAKLHVTGNMRVDNLAGTGKVQLYADDAGTVTGVLPVAFSARGVSYPLISNNTETTVPFEQEIFDEAGFFNASTYEFSAPTKGIYHFDSSVIFGNVTNTIYGAVCRMKILVDGNLSAITIQPMVVSNFQSLNLSQDIKLNAGQKVKITVQQDSGNGIVLTGINGACIFSGHLAIRL